jgi:hypothetical protein
MSRRHDSQSEVRGRHTARVEGWSWELATDQRLIAELRRHRVRNAAHVVSAARVRADRRQVDHVRMTVRMGPEPAQSWCSHPTTGWR